MLHYSYWYAGALSKTPLGRIYAKVASNGWMGVDLFFVLSGFLITGILLDSNGSPHFFRNFYARRTLRIFPLYYGVLAVVFLVLPRTPLAWAGIQAGASHQAWLWLYGANFEVYKLGWGLPDPAPLIVTHFWSLAVEEHFYLIWPLVVYLSSRRGLVVVSIVCVLTSLAFRLWIVRHHVRSTAYLLTPCKADALAIGGLLAAALRTHTRGQLLSTLRPIGICAAVLLIGNRVAGRSFPIRMLRHLDSSLLAALFGWLVAEGALLLSATSFMMRLLAKSPLTILGRYSYGMYVIHQLINHVLHQSIGARLPHLGALPEAILYFFIAGMISFAAAYASFHCYEKWFLKLKRHFPVQA